MAMTSDGIQVGSKEVKLWDHPTARYGGQNEHQSPYGSHGGNHSIYPGPSLHSHHSHNSMKADETSLEIPNGDDDDHFDGEYERAKANALANKALHSSGHPDRPGLPFFILSGVAGLLALFLALACVISSLHRIPEGHVGVYFTNGALSEESSAPGIHWSRPFVTRVERVKVRPETKVLDPLVCTTRDGVKNVFRDVQVISSLDQAQVIPLVREFGVNLKELLIYERVTEAIQRFCANNSIDEVYNTRFLDVIDFVNETLRQNLERFVPESGAIVIWNVFLPKPDVPPAIAANYRQVKVEWTKQLVAQQQQRTDKILKETEKMKALSDAERAKAVEHIHIEQLIQEEEGRRNITEIQSQVFRDKMRMEADTMSYVQEQEASSNKLLLTDEYLRLNVAKSLVNNTKIYFSGKDSLVGGVLGQVFGARVD